MTTRASHRRRGNTFESDVVAWARGRGHFAERLPLNGARDQGDLYLYDMVKNRYTVFECKAPGSTGKILLSQWMNETEAEAQHFAKARGLDLLDLINLGVRGALVIRAYRRPIEDSLVLVPSAVEPTVKSYAEACRLLHTKAEPSVYLKGKGSWTNWSYKMTTLDRYVKDLTIAE